MGDIDFAKMQAQLGQASSQALFQPRTKGASTFSDFVETGDMMTPI